jgi:hypothetical protein
VSANAALYVLPNPAGYQILTPRFVEYDKKPVDQKSEDQLDLEWAELCRGSAYNYYRPSLGDAGVDQDNWRYAYTDRPQYFFCPTPNEIRLVGIPLSAPTVGINANVYAHPIRGVTEIDDWIYNSWNDVIVARALADLMSKDNKPFSNPKMAMKWDEMYLERCGKITDAALRGHTRNNRQHLRTRVWK